MFNNEKGLAMLVVISLILMLLILGGAVLMISTGHFGTSYHQIKRARAYYAAEAAMQHALWSCRTGAPGYNLAIGPWPIRETIRITDPDYTLDARIEIYEQGNEPSDPADTHRIEITVDY